MSLLVVAGCGEGGPTGTTRPDGNGGTGGDPTGAELLVGTWRTVLVVEVPGDLQTWTTVWRFDDDGTCRQTVTTESLAEGFPRTTEHDCTYEAGDFEVIIDLDDGRRFEVDYSFADFSPDRLVLDGFEYERLA